jgi:hypothetical protein
MASMYEDTKGRRDHGQMHMQWKYCIQAAIHSPKSQISRQRVTPGQKSKRVTDFLPFLHQKPLVKEQSGSSEISWGINDPHCNRIRSCRSCEHLASNKAMAKTSGKIAPNFLRSASYCCHGSKWQSQMEKPVETSIEKQQAKSPRSGNESQKPITKLKKWMQNCSKSIGESPENRTKDQN